MAENSLRSDLRVFHFKIFHGGSMFPDPLADICVMDTQHAVPM